MLALHSSFSTAATAANSFRRVTVASVLSGRAALSTATNGTSSTNHEAPQTQTLLDFIRAGTKEQPAPDTPPTSGNYPRTHRVPSRRATNLPMSTTESPFKQRSHLRYRVHCRASRNNTMVQVTEPDGKTVAWYSGGSLKFKGVNRSSYEAGYQCAVKAIQTIREVVREKGEVQLELYFRGFGQGRDAMKTALLAAEGEGIRHMFSLIQDRTPIKIGGTRAPKARRL